MKIFHCDNCQQLVFYENIQCVNCKHALAFLPDVLVMGALEPAGENVWRPPGEDETGPVYRLCQNYSSANVCNWAVPVEDPNPLCRSCRLTRVIPDLSRPGHPEAWYRLEVAKRRLVYTLLSLGLPLASKLEDPEDGLAFEFLADPDPATPAAAPILTGHDNGVITINVAEADDAEREKRRLAMHEPYRTLLGHFRHEIAHYYWDRLIKDSHWLPGFRERFGDEREDYAQALQRHYEKGPPGDWPNHFVTAYASSHAWEDWAETWAHFLHMTDTLETAIACGLSLRPRRPDEPAMKPNLALRDGLAVSFDDMIERWFPLTYVLNSLNRGLGLQDGYPFVLSAPAIDKLRFIYEVIRSPAIGATGGMKK
jgi:hypothetical protein